MWFQFLSGKDLALSRVVWLISKPLCHPMIFLQNVVVKSCDRTDIRCSFFTLMLMQHKNWASLERSLLPVEIGQPGQQQSIWLSWTIREKALVMRSTHSRSVGGCRARVTRQAATCVLKARAFYDRILSGLNTINLASLHFSKPGIIKTI